MTADRNGTENGFHRRFGFLGFWDEKVGKSDEEVLRGFWLINGVSKTYSCEAVYSRLAK